MLELFAYVVILLSTGGVVLSDNEPSALEKMPLISHQLPPDLHVYHEPLTGNIYLVED